MGITFDEVNHLWWKALTIDTRQYAFFACLTWAVLWVALRAPLRARKIRPASPPALRMALEFLVSIRSIAIFATAVVGMTAVSTWGGYPLAERASKWGEGWFWTSLILMILGHDAYYYWTHRAMHAVSGVSRIHRWHHQSRNPSPFSAYSFDLGEACVMVLFVAVWPLVVPTPWPVISLFALHQIVRNTMAHAGYELMPSRADGRPLFDWMTTTTHHDLHHERPGCNFGLYFTWWDRWMGTEAPDYHQAFARVASQPLLVGRGWAPAVIPGVERKVGASRA